MPDGFAVGLQGLRVRSRVHVSSGQPTRHAFVPPGEEDLIQLRFGALKTHHRSGQIQQPRSEYPPADQRHTRVTVCLEPPHPVGAGKGVMLPQVFDIDDLERRSPNLIWIRRAVPSRSTRIQDGPRFFWRMSGGAVPVRSIFRDATARQLGRRLVLFSASQTIAEAAFLSDLERCAHVNPHVGLTFAIADAVPRSIVAAACTIREFLNPDVLRPWPYDAGTINADLLHAHLRDTNAASSIWPVPPTS